jgi:threonine dehydrogenase-like Zn-dependent dehydrogenase
MVALVATKYGTSVKLVGLRQDTARLLLAEELGINCEYFDSLPRGLTDAQSGFDLVFEVSGSSAAIDRALDLVRPGGELIAIGIGDPSVLDWNKIVRKELTAKGVYRRNPSTWFRAAKLLKELGPRLKNIGTTYSLENAVEAFEDAKNRRVMKAILAP